MSDSEHRNPFTQKEIKFRPQAMVVDVTSGSIATNPREALDLQPIQGELIDPHVESFFSLMTRAEQASTKSADSLDEVDLYQLKSVGLNLLNITEDLDKSAGVSNGLRYAERKRFRGRELPPEIARDQAQEFISIRDVHRQTVALREKVERRLRVIDQQLANYPDSNGSTRSLPGLRYVAAGAVLAPVTAEATLTPTITTNEHISPAPWFAEQNAASQHDYQLSMADLEAFFSFDTSIHDNAALLVDNKSEINSNLHTIDTLGQQNNPEQQDIPTILTPTAMPVSGEVNIRIEPTTTGDLRGTADSLNLSQMIIRGSVINNQGETWYYLRDNANNTNYYVREDLVRFNNLEEQESVPDLTNTYNLFHDMSLLDRSGLPVESRYADGYIRLEVANSIVQGLITEGFPSATFQEGNLSMFQPNEGLDTRRYIFKQTETVQNQNGTINEAGSVFVIDIDSSQMIRFAFLPPGMISDTLEASSLDSTVDFLPTNNNDYLKINSNVSLDINAYLGGATLAESFVNSNEVVSDNNAPSTTLLAGYTFDNPGQLGNVNSREIAPDWSIGAWETVPEMRLSDGTVIPYGDTGIRFHQGNTEYAIVAGRWVGTRLITGSATTVRVSAFYTEAQGGRTNGFVQVSPPYDSRYGYSFTLSDSSIFTNENNQRSYAVDDIFTDAVRITDNDLMQIMGSQDGQAALVAIPLDSDLNIAFVEGRPVTTTDARIDPNSESPHFMPIILQIGS